NLGQVLYLQHGGAPSGKSGKRLGGAPEAASQDVGQNELLDEVFDVHARRLQELAERIVEGVVHFLHTSPAVQVGEQLERVILGGHINHRLGDLVLDFSRDRRREGNRVVRDRGGGGNDDHLVVHIRQVG